MPVDRDQHDASVPATIRSLILAFVLALAFRGFVLEGFVIPTGSMAPTLLGQHLRLRSPASGWEFTVDAAPVLEGSRAPSLVDPILGDAVTGVAFARNTPLPTPEGDDLLARVRPGDRILVLKWSYALVDPDRWDVVVFKNPTDPEQNYIKRLIGLPGEDVLIADGDVFVRPTGTEAPFRVARKPAFVQRALWQPLHESRYRPAGRGAGQYREPWEAELGSWSFDPDGVYRRSEPGPSVLRWSNRRRRLTDWTSYNMISQRVPPEVMLYAPSDLRLRASIEPGEGPFATVFELGAREHVFEFTLTDGMAGVRYRPQGAPPNEWTASDTAPIAPLPRGRGTEVEFWHVDQTMSIFVDGRLVVDLPYEMSARERLRLATGREAADPNEAVAFNEYVDRVLPSDPSLSWSFRGPVTLRRVGLDRDLYYRPADLTPSSQSHPPRLAGPGYGTHPSRPARLGPDQFFFLGDNSANSLDGRLWGSPAPLVASQLDDAPFVVPRELLIGKAFFVYFPSPLEIREGGARVVPDFGRMRFVR